MFKIIKGTKTINKSKSSKDDKGAIYTRAFERNMAKLKSEDLSEDKLNLITNRAIFYGVMEVIYNKIHITKTLKKQMHMQIFY
jgi:hypothetical protein